MFLLPKRTEDRGGFWNAVNGMMEMDEFERRLVSTIYRIGAKNYMDLTLPIRTM